MLRPSHLVVAAAVGILLGVSNATSAGGASFTVIVNPKNPVGSVAPEFLRHAFLGKEAAWSNGETVRPVDLPVESPVRDSFARAALKKTPAQVRAYWNQQVFSGKGVPPPEAESISEAIEYVLANPGAIGYLPAGMDARGAKTVAVR